MIFKTIPSSIDRSRQALALFNKDWNIFKSNWITASRIKIKDSIYNENPNQEKIYGERNIPLSGGGFRAGVSSLFHSRDVNALKEYDRLTKAGISHVQAYKEAMTGCTEAARKNAVAMKKGTMTLQEAIVNLGGMTLSAKAATVALKALSIAGNIVAMIAISKAVQLVISAYDDYIHRLDNAKEALDSSTGSYESNKKELEELQKQVDECAKSIANLEKLEKDGSISIIQQDELDTLRQTNEELQRELLIKQELAKMDARKVADDAVKLFNTSVDSEYTGNIYYKSRIIGNVTQADELGFSIEEYQRLAEQQKQNDIAYANGEISLKKYIKTNDKLIQGMSDARNRATEMADVINQAGSALQTLQSSGEELTFNEKEILAQTNALGDEYSDFIHQIDATTNAFDHVNADLKL